MDIEVKIDQRFNKTKIVIYANEVNSELTNIIDEISCINQKNIKAYKDGKMYILRQEQIETIYSERGNIYARSNNEIYIIKSRLYQIETMLNKKIFVRISNSEIVNFNKIENIDFKIVGTLVINFKSGNKSYSSRRYIPKIKEFLEI